MKKVITYGTYDLLHVGHINLLRRAKELGDYLIVVLSSDEFNAIKGKKAYHSYEDRKIILEAIKYVDEVLPEYTWEQKIDDVVNNKVDVFVMDDAARDAVIRDEHVIAVHVRTRIAQPEGRISRVTISIARSHPI